MQLKKQSVEVRQNEKRYSKENNTSDNPIQKRIIPVITQSQDEKISNQSTM